MNTGTHLTPSAEGQTNTVGGGHEGTEMGQEGKEGAPLHTGSLSLRGEARA